MHNIFMYVKNEYKAYLYTKLKACLSQCDLIFDLQVVLLMLPVLKETEVQKLSKIMLEIRGNF